MSSLDITIADEEGKATATQVSIALPSFSFPLEEVPFLPSLASEPFVSQQYWNDSLSQSIK